MTLRSRLTARSYKLPPHLSEDVCVDKNQPVLMRDGTILRGDRWYSANSPNQPVVLMRTPYGRSLGFAMVARLFAERGFQVFLQSCRGTSNSGGAFNPVRQEPEDGIDTLEWLQRQSWCIGKIFTFGLSYLGFVQWAIAKQAGDRLAAMTLHCTLSNYRNEVLAFGGLALEGAFGWGSIMSKLTGASSTLDLILSLRKRIDPKMYAHLPLRDLDRISAGKEIPWWQDWLSHPEPTDPWWEAIDFTSTIPDIKASATMIAGWHDLFLPWQIKDFEAMQALGRDVWLTVGPWHHTSKEGGKESVRQGLSLFSAQARGQQSFTDRDRVRLYVMGENKWNDYAAWPPPDSREEHFYLHSDATLSIEPPLQTSFPTRFVYDPADPTPSFHAPSPFSSPSKKPDMKALESRADAICFTSATLLSDIDVIGPVSVDIHIRSNKPHTDVYACLCDVDNYGLSLKVCDGYQRLRPDDAALDEKGVRRVEISCWPTAYRFRRDHRLRLIIASGAHPRFARNLGTGEPLGTATQMVKQHQEVFHDARYRSALRVRICSADKQRLP